MSKTDIQGIGHCTYEAVATQAALGMMVLLTGLFALSSSFFLVYSITEGQPGLAWFVPLLYATAIITFDRELVGYTPPSELSGLKKIINMLPRLIFACVLGFAIAIPMEHKLMEKAIEEEIASQVSQASSEVAARSNAVRSDIAQMRDQLRKEVEDARARLTSVEGRLNDEYTIRGGRGPRYEALQAERDRIEQSFKEAQARYSGYKPSREQVEAAQAADKIIGDRTREVRTDILKRTEALQRIRDRSPAADLLSILVTLVFVLLELFPIILKLFQRYNEYHAYLEVRRRLAIQKSHVLGNYALEFIEKYPATAARMELTDLLQVAGEDPVAAPQVQTSPPPLAAPNPFVQLAGNAVQNPPPSP